MNWILILQLVLSSYPVLILGHLCPTTNTTQPVLPPNTRRSRLKLPSKPPHLQPFFLARTTRSPLPTPFRPLLRDILTPLVPSLQIDAGPFPHGPERVVPEGGVRLSEIGLRAVRTLLATL